MDDFLFEGYVVEVDLLRHFFVIDEQEISPIKQMVMHDETLLNNNAPNLRDKVDDLSQKEEILIAQHGFEEFQLLDFGVIIDRFWAVKKDFQDIFFVDFVVKRTIKLNWDTLEFFGICCGFIALVAVGTHFAQFDEVSEMFENEIAVSIIDNDAKLIIVYIFLDIVHS